MSDTLAALRARIQAIEGRPAVESVWVPSRVAALDEALGGLPRPGSVEIVGPCGSGRTRLVLAMVAQASMAEPVLWVDPLAVFFPPTARDFGVHLERLIVARPEPAQVVWTVEQGLRAGCFPLVVIDLPEPIPGAGPRWTRAAQLGATTLVVLCEKPSPELAPTARLVVARGTATVARHRAGRQGRTFSVPPWQVP